MLYQITVTEHDENVKTSLLMSDVDTARHLRSKLLRELGSQVAITDPEPVEHREVRTKDEIDRACRFVAMVM